MIPICRCSCTKTKCAPLCQQNLGACQILSRSCRSSQTSYTVCRVLVICHASIALRSTLLNQHTSNRFCFIIGTIPTELALLTSLTRLELQHNAFHGSIPWQISLLSKQLTQLKLNNNALTGTLPTLLGQLTQLSWFLVNENDLTGTLPTELGTLRRSAVGFCHFDATTVISALETGCGNHLQALYQYVFIGCPAERKLFLWHYPHGTGQPQSSSVLATAGKQ